MQKQLNQKGESSMKRSVAILALSTVFLSTAAFAQSAAEKTGINSTLGIAPKTADFVKEAAMSDMLEIEAAKIAQQKGDADEKAFAAKMITDHTKTSSDLKRMVSGDLKAALPTSLDDSSQKKLGKLRDAKPDNFASEYDPMQVSAHKDATSLFEGRRRSEVEGLGRQNARRPAASSRDGAGPEQEAQVTIESRACLAGFPLLANYH
jgi:putative membrane protein